MSRLLVSLLCATALVPFVAFAAPGAMPAGFAPGSLWLSKTEATAGESLKIFTVVYDSTTSPIEGDVVFHADTKDTGTQHFKLAAGETQILSADWVATAGTHTFSASIKNITGVSGTVANTETNSVSIKVAEPPPPPPPSATTQAVNTVSNVIASSTPVVVSVAEKVFALSESVRNGAVEALKKQLAASESPKGQVLGASTYRAPQGGTTSADAGNGSIVGSIWRGLLSGLLFVCNLKLLFYGLLLFVIFVLYKLLRTMLRERRARSY